MAGLSLRGHGKESMGLLVPCLSRRHDLGSKRNTAVTAFHIHRDSFQVAAGSSCALPVRPIVLYCNPGIHLPASRFPHPFCVALERNLGVRLRIACVRTHAPLDKGYEQDAGLGD